MNTGTDWLCEILQNVQLEQFYLPIRDQLQITRLAHFDYVHVEDLERIGISKPGIRRLFDAVRKKKLQLWNRKFWNKLFGSSSSASKEKSELAVRPASQPENRTTCIILEKDIVLHNEIGNGSFGVVRKGEWKTPEQVMPVAVKVLKADAFTQLGVYDDFRREVEAMHSLKHPNLIRLHGVVFHPLMMICELAPMGALLDYIRAQNGKISLHYVSRWSEQVAAGMAHLEKNRFLHRDLACRNILLTTLELVKIGDFGLMRPLPDADDCYVMSERRRVPFPWCAPESLHTRQFSHASDVWMFAVALWEMYSFGEEPWMGLNGSEILRLTMREGQRLAAPAACPPDAYMLMMQCWDLNPKERPTFAGIRKYMDTFKFETAVAALSYRKQGQMTIDAGDAIVLIDKRPELHWWKGQNQRTLEVGLFPSTIVTTSKSKIHAIKKAQTLSPAQKAATLAPSPISANGSLDDSAVTLRKRRTIESVQPPTTRAGNSGNKHFNYNKLTNDRAATLQGRLSRPARDAYSKSLNHVKEDLLIDLELPPRASAAPGAAALRNDISILDEPIDVPEINLEPDWGEPSIESLPSYSSSSPNKKNYSNLYGAKSLDNLILAIGSNSQMSLSQPDPFDTSQMWPVDGPTTSTATSVVARPNYNIQLEEPSIATPTNNESRTYSNNRYSAASRTNNITQTYNNGAAIGRSNSTYLNNSVCGTLPNSTYANTSALSMDRNARYNATITNSLADMSLDDRISASLNLRTNEDNIYANTPQHDVPIDAATTSTVAPNNTSNNQSNDIHIYGNLKMNPAQQQFILETKDYYTKLSTPTGHKTMNDYEKNIYVPKYEEEGEKLQNFSDTVQNSKNYSSKKYANSDFDAYGYSGSVGSTWSISTFATYDEVNDTASNVYSEIGESSGAGAEGAYGSTRLYDEVYEAAVPRPHRPAPPCPTNPK